MNIVDEAISDLAYAYEALKSQTDHLSEAEMNETVIGGEDGLTIHDLLAQLVGWQDYVVEVLPSMVLTINTKLHPVDVAARNRQAIMQRRALTGRDIMTEFGQKHKQIVDLLQTISPDELVLRRTMGPKVFTIKSYVIDTIQNEILKCADDLQVRHAAGTGSAEV